MASDNFSSESPRLSRASCLYSSSPVSLSPPRNGPSLGVALTARSPSGVTWRPLCQVQASQLRAKTTPLAVLMPHPTGVSPALSSSCANSSGCLQPARSVPLSFPERESLNCICLIASHFKFYVRCFVDDFYYRSHVLSACRLSQTL